MDARRWHQFLSFLDRAHSKPTYEAEEREFRLRTARDLNQALAGPPDGTLLEALGRIFGRSRSGLEHGFRDPGIAGPGDIAWLHTWARADASLPGLLHDFGSGGDPVERFGRFGDAAAEAGVSDNVEAILSIGSLLNFAQDPESLPIVQSAPFDEIECTLGYRVSGQETPLEQYVRHLTFTDEVLMRAREAGVSLTDVLDAANLILVASEDTDYWASGFDVWASDASRVHSAPKQKPAYLSVCAIYRDEAPYLREWIEFHRLVGVERFFLYDNDSFDEHREVLAPYLEDGTVVLHEWPVIPGRRSATRRKTSMLNPQSLAYTDCLRWHRGDSRWIAFIDVDEFLFSPTGTPLPELLPEFERWPGVVVNWAMFDSSGHRAQPEGPVIANYRNRLSSPRNQVVKSIVQPARTVRNRSGHHFLYTSLSAVDENHYPARSYMTKSVSFSRLRINHYFTKSEEEFLRKMERRRVGGVPFDPSQSQEIKAQSGEPDESILIYLDALEEALGGTSGST